MIITFSKLAIAKHAILRDMATAVEMVVNEVSVDNYRLTWDHDSPIGNLLASITWAKGRRVRFTLETRDAWKKGSRTSSAGRHMCKASWEAHRDVLRALFKLDPQASVKTALAIYCGRDDFEREFPATGRKNIGSMMQPKTMPECTVR